MPLLDLAQRQVGADDADAGLAAVPVIEFVAKQIGVPYMRVYEVATFYTMYNLAPVGRYPRPGLRDDAVHAARLGRRAGGVQEQGPRSKGKTTPDGLFTLTEVECLGACANAPMVQINDDNFEDLTYDSTIAILEALAEGRKRSERRVPQIGAPGQLPRGRPDDAEGDGVGANHDYRGEW